MALETLVSMPEVYPYCWELEIGIYIYIHIDNYTQLLKLWFLCSQMNQTYAMVKSTSIAYCKNQGDYLQYSVYMVHNMSSDDEDCIPVMN